MFDVLTIAALNDEFATRLVGGRVQRVIQIEDTAIGLEVYAEHRRQVLIASADSRNPRLYLTSARVSAMPDRVTPLLLLLRKYARGGVITAVQQPPLERISRLSIAKRFLPHKDDDGAEEEPDSDETPGEIVHAHLIIELMGRRSNIILASDDGRILDAAKRVTPEMSRVRPILPGRPYVPPPAQIKADPRHLTPQGLRSILAGIDPGERLVDGLVRTLAGFSPQMARETVYRTFAGIDTTVAQAREAGTEERLAAALAEVVAPLETSRWHPCVYTRSGEAIAFSAIPLRYLIDAEEEHFDSISVAVERFLALAGEAQPVRQSQRRDRLVGEIRSARERVESRLHSLHEEQRRMAEGERWREMGELIYAYLYTIQPGQAELQADGMTIPLDPALTPSENAQAYFERYRKAQSAERNLPELIEQAETERSYLAQLETLAGFAEGMDEIEQLRQEWESYRTGTQPTGAKELRKPRRAEPKRPTAFRTERGDLIYVGRNGRQNDLVTFELAQPDDLWLHARGLPGAHVIIHWAGPEENGLIEQAAELAAYYSGGRESTSVDVDVTQRRYVRKIKGAGPGMVIYRNESTLSVHPQSPEALRLRPR